MKRVLKGLVTLMMLTPVQIYAVTDQLPKTGQTDCWNINGGSITCSSQAGQGQDGDKQAVVGVPWPNPRFSDQNNGTITDNLTGLIWLKNASCDNGAKSWHDALALSNFLQNGDCGLTDGSIPGNWRLPNIVELESLVNLQQTYQYGWLQNQGFSNVQSAKYWSSTSYVPNGSTSNSVYTVDMSANGPGAVGTDTKSGYLFWVLPVRTGQLSSIQLSQTGQTLCWDTSSGSTIPCNTPSCIDGDGKILPTCRTGQDGDTRAGIAWPSPRFHDNGNGTVTDYLTGLIWLKNANCYSNILWPTALQNANALRAGTCGLTDYSRTGMWRLPNRKELFSLLITQSPVTDWLTSQGFSNIANSYYWTSDTNVSSPIKAWTCYTGTCTSNIKSSSYYFLAVRSPDLGLDGGIALNTNSTLEYLDLMTALNSAQADNTIYSKNTVVSQIVNFSGGFSVTLKGGFDNTYTTNVNGTTILNGPLIISTNGSCLTIDNLTIQ